MTIGEVHSKLDALIKGFPESGYESVPDSVIAELDSFVPEAAGLGMKSGKELIENLVKSLKTRKTGGNTDDSVLVRATALDFYLQNLPNEAVENL
jgi:hypothetical protein